MSEPKHTPAPWTVERGVLAQGIYHLAITARHAGQDWMPCSITPMDSMRPIDEANARLIAAAPELLESLRQLLRETNSIEVLGEWEALDKNTGLRKTTRARIDSVIERAVKAFKEAGGKFK